MMCALFLFVICNCFYLVLYIFNNKYDVYITVIDVEIAVFLPSS
jgi:hypothetical protein